MKQMVIVALVLSGITLIALMLPKQERSPGEVREFQFRLIDDHRNCFDWAFGKSLIMGDEINAMHYWNQEHGNLMLIKGSDKVVETLHKIIRICNDQGIKETN